MFLVSVAVRREIKKLLLNYYYYSIKKKVQITKPNEKNKAF